MLRPPGSGWLASQLATYINVVPGGWPGVRLANELLLTVNSLMFMYALYIPISTQGTYIAALAIAIR